VKSDGWTTITEADGTVTTGMTTVNADGTLTFEEMAPSKAHVKLLGAANTGFQSVLPPTSARHL
jgi:hypothetical protein